MPSMQVIVVYEELHYADGSIVVQPMTAYPERVGATCLHRYQHAQQEEGIGLSFMTAKEREIARHEWQRKLRELVEHSNEQSAQRERERVRMTWDAYDE